MSARAERVQEEWERRLSDLKSSVEFYNSESITVRIHFLSKLMEKAQYRHSTGGRYWDRVQTYLKGIPAEHRHGALALLGGVLYLPVNLMLETVDTIAADVEGICAQESIDLPEAAHVFAVDHPGLIEQLYERGARHGWTGRMDQLLQRDIRTVRDLLQMVAGVRIDSPPAKEVRNLVGLLRKKLWILLTDNALSGTSAKSDAARLQRIADLLCEDGKPRILVAAHLATERALCEIERVVSRENVVVGLTLGSEFSVNSSECALFSQEGTLRAVRRFCEWYEIGRAHV